MRNFTQNTHLMVYDATTGLFGLLSWVGLSHVCSALSHVCCLCLPSRSSLPSSCLPLVLRSPCCACSFCSTAASSPPARLPSYLRRSSSSAKSGHACLFLSCTCTSRSIAASRLSPDSRQLGLRSRPQGVRVRGFVCAGRGTVVAELLSLALHAGGVHCPCLSFLALQSTTGEGTVSVLPTLPNSRGCNPLAYGR